MINKFKFVIAYALGSLYYPFFRMKRIKIMSIEETVKFMNKPGNSIVRFGDGEFSIISGKSIENYQDYSHQLSDSLKEALLCTSYDNLLVCLPQTLSNFDNIKKESCRIWKAEIFKNISAYSKYCLRGKTYGNAFVSRPYMIFKENGSSNNIFEAILNIFYDKEIIVIEGKYSRTGVQNNLFSKSKSVNRIICPSSNAFDKYETILEEALKIKKNSLILVALGPAGKKLVVDLSKRGYWVLDIGHIDSEYEWYLSSSKSKEVVKKMKHTAEFSDSDIEDCNDKEYLTSIIAIIK